MKRVIGFFILFFTCSMRLEAAIQTQIVDYKDGDTVLEGFLAYDDSIQGKRPGVLIVHDWLGQGEYSERRAKQLAELGYAAFALDMYGKGVRAKDNQEAGKLAGMYKSDRALMRQRASAGLETLKRNPLVLPDKIAAIGYCFGGTTVLEIARSGEILSGVISFHGGLETSMPAEAGKVKAKILVLHGADDPFVPPAEVEAFKREMISAGANMRFMAYPGAVHSFTKREAGNDNSTGAAYNEQADVLSWEEMKKFFGEIFAS